MNCAQCQKPLTSYFQLSRVDVHGKTSSTIQLCSIICVLQYAYTYGTLRGVQGALAVKNTVSGLLSAIRGEKS